GFDLCRVIKAEPALKDVPVIFVTAHAEQEFEVRALEAGACDFIAKPVNEAVLRARVTTHLQIRRLTASLRELATTDALTGLANRR
ncbi:response regulator, partial [Enterococcus faecalis]|uniref:response regulator n=1 Tax=Enterococcus faecalis TaxID=1351 RepID=UPI00403F7810